METSTTLLVCLLLTAPIPNDANSIAAIATDSLSSPAPRPLALPGRHLSKVRVHTPAGSYVLRRPRFGPEGVAWLEAEGFPRGPRPLLASAAWDTTPAPPNPVPWERIDLLERQVSGGQTGLVVGAAVGALGGGAAGGFLGFGAAMSGSGSFGTMLGTAAFGALTGGLILGIASHVLFDRPARWEAVGRVAVERGDPSGTSR